MSNYRDLIGIKIHHPNSSAATDQHNSTHSSWRPKTTSARKQWTASKTKTRKTHSSPTSLKNQETLTSWRLPASAFRHRRGQISIPLPTSTWAQNRRPPSATSWSSPPKSGSQTRGNPWRWRWTCFRWRTSMPPRIISIFRELTRLGMFRRKTALNRRSWSRTRWSFIWICFLHQLMSMRRKGGSVIDGLLCLFRWIGIYFWIKLKYECLV